MLPIVSPLIGQKLQLNPQMLNSAKVLEHCKINYQFLFYILISKKENDKKMKYKIISKHIKNKNILT